MLRVKDSPAGLAGGLAAGNPETSAQDAPGFHPYFTTGCSTRQEFPKIRLPDGRVAGHITPDGWLVKRNLDPARHRLRAFGGAWATDEAHLTLPIVGIRLKLANGTVLEATLDVWRRYGIPWDGGEYGRQVALPERYWTRVGDAPAADAVQLPLLPGLEEVRR